MQEHELQAMASAYIEAALFTADEELVEPKSGPFDQTPYLSRITQKMKDEAYTTCAEFYRTNSADLQDYPATDAGHDLWYTRNGHGAGFWENDHCTEEQGKRLTSAAQKLGEKHLWKAWGWFHFE